VTCFGSLFSGIEAASVAWQRLDWRCAFVAEVDPFCNAVLRHRHPRVPHLGDVTATDFVSRAIECGPVDVLVGGSPCQAFSVAGRRGGLADERGALTLRYVEIVHAIAAAHPRLRWVVWENVPGVLSDRENAFGCFLAGLVGSSQPLQSEAGEESSSWPRVGVVAGPQGTAAWRVLDAQYFGLAQRRERVFVVFSPGDRANPVEVLLECDGVRRDTPPRRPTATPSAGRAAEGVAGRHAPLNDLDGVARTLGTFSGGASGKEQQETLIGEADIAHAVTSKWAKGTGGPSGDECQNLVPIAVRENSNVPLPDVAHTLRGSGHDASEDGTGRGTPLVPCAAYQCHGGNVGPMGTLRKGNGNAAGGVPFIAAVQHGHGSYKESQAADTLRASGGDGGGGSEAIVAFHGAQDPDISGDVTHPLGRNQGREVCVAFRASGQERFEPRCIAPVAATDGGGAGVPTALDRTLSVRRLTPRECERLQGFADDYTLVPYRGKPAKDGPRYRALGNSIACQVLVWLAKRMEQQEVREVRLATGKPWHGREIRRPQRVEA
jgi:DNA (cytosine-5)-methyltransferase 1